MGQLLAKVKRQKVVTVNVIADSVFEKFTHKSGKGTLSFLELYTAILLVYNGINKKLPGPHHDPPTREEVEDLLKEFDTNEDGVLDKEEFHDFLHKFTRNLYHGVTKTLIIYSMAPLLALVAKRATEQLPRVGPVVRRIPNFFYATVVTTFVAILGHTKQIED